jgi:hypothetical protein
MNRYIKGDNEKWNIKKDGLKNEQIVPEMYERNNLIIIV